MSARTELDATTAWGRFETTTSRWGRLTMIAALVLMVTGPAILATQVGIDPGLVVTGVIAIAVVYGAVWAVEPLSYFPILGSASMYQAFMIGNIANKLLPAAIVAQSAIGAKPETRRGQLAAVLAICGAAVVHVVSLAVLVGVAGTVLLQLIPSDVIASIQTFILPAVMGAVVIQMIASNPKPRILGIAIAAGILTQVVLTPLVPAFAPFGVAGSVLLTIGVSLLLANRSTGAPAAPLTDTPTEGPR